MVLPQHVKPLLNQVQGLLPPHSEKGFILPAPSLWKQEESYFPKLFRGTSSIDLNCNDIQ